MALRDNDPLRDLEAQLQREDPTFVRAMSAWPPRQPREHRVESAWIPVALTGSGLVALGIAFTQGFLLLVGLFVLTVSAYLFCRAGAPDGRSSGSHQSDDDGPDGGVGASTG